MAKTVPEIKSHKRSPEEACEDVPQSVHDYNHSEQTQCPRKAILLEEMQETEINRKCHWDWGTGVCATILRKA